MELMILLAETFNNIILNVVESKHIVRQTAEVLVEFLTEDSFD